MCGINGILYFHSFDKNKPKAFHEENMRRMNNEIIHRGPDSEGIHIDYPLCFGFRRLSIIDLSENANQPMFNEDRSVAIIFNGEIYNYLELIPELKRKGHIFKTKSDTEVILHSYEEYGLDCVRKFNGMWAFALYDFKNKIFFASRDRFGVKPFYYYLDNDSLIFSSEIKAILKVNNITNANHGKVFDYLSYGYKTSNGETFFEDIKELKPAHNLIILNKEIRFVKYWDPEKYELKNESAEDALRSLVHDSVKIRYRSDVPVSILLSGGLDSTIIAKTTDELIEVHELQSESVTAFTAVFPGFMYDESAAVKEFLATCKHITPFEILPDNKHLLGSINDFVYGMGEPVFSTTSFAHYILMKEIKKQNVKVVLNGQGSDEVWSGYDRYFIGYFLLDLLLSEPKNFLKQMNSISEKMKFSVKYILAQTAKAALSRRYSSYFRAKYREKIIDTLSKDFFTANYNYFSNPDYKKLSSGNLSGYMKYNLQHQGFSQILHYEDHSSMQSSIEMRSPFIDYRLIELAFTLPTEKKIDHGVTKKILREVFKDKLPDSIINNYRKIGFATPFEDWMNEPGTKTFIDNVLNSRSFSDRKIFKAAKIRKIFNDSKINKNFPFWRVINLELWSNAYNISNL
ncbi:MAG: asparagine synthase (glutamine-hydrolyzing) [Ignavibacteria bacterium]